MIFAMNSTIQQQKRIRRYWKNQIDHQIFGNSISFSLSAASSSGVTFILKSKKENKREKKGKKAYVTMQRRSRESLKHRSKIEQVKKLNILMTYLTFLKEVFGHFIKTFLKRDLNFCTFYFLIFLFILVHILYFMLICDIWFAFNIK